MSDDQGQQEKKTADANSTASEEARNDTAGPGPGERPKNESGPTFTEAPDPLAGLRRWVSGVLASMDGKTVSMKTYVGTIIGVVVLMMLARCGG